MLPSPHDRLIDLDLAAQLRNRDLTPLDPGELLTLKFGAESPPSIRSPLLWCHWNALL